MSLASRLQNLKQKYGDSEAEDLLAAFIKKEFPGKIALVSSFGVEAGLLLDMAARIDPGLSVVFLDTRKLFPETLEYKDHLIKHFGLSNVKTYYPAYTDVARDDPDDTLYAHNPNSCCYIRKVKPLNAALEGYDAWITGRKRYHGGMRTRLPHIELLEGRIKINPLAAWSAQEIQEEFDRRAIPLHPLLEKGYTSVGCEPCTALPSSEDVRSGRWEGQDKTECGIHLDQDGRLVGSEKDG